MIGIITVGDIIGSPYINNYVKELDNQELEFEVLFWNREGLRRDLPENFYSYDRISSYNMKTYKKIVDFIGFSKWCREVIRRKKYSKLIILTTLTGIFLADLLTTKYKNKFIFDIRDYSYEHNRLFYDIEKRVISSSKFTCISSEGFMNFLPSSNKYVVCHNFKPEELNNRRKLIKKSPEEKLNVVFIGAIRYFNHQVKVINKLRNDKRFNMIYHGHGAEFSKFVNYCTMNGIDNIQFTGRYDDSDKAELLIDADILNNSYMTSKFMEVKYAISNKFYDGLIYGIPQLVEIGTFKQELVENKGIGIGIDVDDDHFADSLYEYYFSISKEEFNYSCSLVLEKIIKESNIYINSIKKFLE